MNSSDDETVFSQAPSSKTHDWYRWMHDREPAWIPARDLCKRLFDRCETYLDPDFADHFPSETPQRYWEMALCDEMLSHGLSLEKGASRKEGMPDFHVQGDEPFWIECVCAGPGEGNNKVPDLEGKDYRLMTPEDYKFEQEPDELKRMRLLRVTSALAGKRKQYDDRVSSGKLGKADRYVIAINTAGVDSRYHDFFEEWKGTRVPEILSAIYPIGAFAIKVDTNGGAAEGGYVFQPTITKTESAVSTRFFFNKDENGNFVDNSGISGILFAEKRILEPDKPHYLFAPNPFARSSFTHNPFPWADEYRCERNEEKGTCTLTKAAASRAK